MSDYSKLLEIQQDKNKQTTVLLQPHDTICEVDLNTRKIGSIDTIVVETDHRSEVIYFKTPRYYDHMDLATTVCLIEYINANKEPHVYVVPFFDVDTFEDEDAIIFPWEISQTVAEKDGVVKFAINFYRVDMGGTKYTYNLNTLPQEFTIKKSLGFTPDIPMIKDEAEITAAYIKYFQDAATQANAGALTWVIL